ncbi:auxin-induced in root cultures protein 12-like [Castanea sativa]|uniref:auxin-induced in root cultures protein 12-like n=1 Tax=Castanea sativa TaxID=21020 RepID=UPI003F64AA3B
MARLCFTLVILALALLVSQSDQSLTCTSQRFTNKNVYTNCTDLSYLNAYLHWTYNTTNSTLSIAFTAPPSKPDGWVSWSINPVKPSMISAQALLAFKHKDNITINTYNVTSYDDATKWGTKLSYEVWDLSAEESNGNITIFGKWKLPENTKMVNQIWQVGPGITDKGLPLSHDKNLDNLKAKGMLQLVGTQSGAAPSPSPSPAGPVPGVPAPAPAGKKKSASTRIGGRISACFYMGLVVILGSLIVF